MEYRKGRWEAVCMGSEGYNIYSRIDKPATEMTSEEWIQDRTPVARLVLGGVVEQLPNAQLIASAPDLYEALRTICEAIHSNEIARACRVAEFNGVLALSKAEGK